MPRIESSKRRYARKTSQRFKAWLIQKNRKARQVVEKICRYFSTFDGSTSYAALTDEIVLSGDFEIELYFKLNQLSGDLNFLSDGANPAIYHFRIDATNGSIDFYYDGSFRSNDGAFIPDLNKHKLVFVKSGNNLKAFYDGAVVHSSTVSSSAMIISYIGRRGDATQNNFNGQLSDLKIWSGGDRTTGDLVLDLPMSEGLKDVYDEVFYRNRVQTQAEWYLNLDGGYVEFQPITLSGDFEVEVDFKKHAAASMSILSGASSFLRIDSNGLVVFRDDNNNQFQSSIFPPDTENHKLVFKYNATTGDLESGIDGAALTTRNAASFPFTIDKAGVRGSGNFDPFNGQISDLKIWSGGDRTTGTLIIDSALDDNSNIIANAASPVNANVWSGTVTATGESSGDINLVNVVSTAGASSQVSVPATVAGDDVLIELTLSSGSLDNIIAGDSTTEFTGWQNIRDSYGQPTNRYQTLMNNNDNEVVLKVSGIADATFTNITARVVEGYGVLQGTRGTDYEWKNETPHAIGYNVTTNEVCTSDGTNWIDADLWIDGDPFID